MGSVQLLLFCLGRDGPRARGTRKTHQAGSQDSSRSMGSLSSSFLLFPGIEFWGSAIVSSKPSHLLLALGTPVTTDQPWPGLRSTLTQQTLRKKGFNGCESPEPDGEDSIDQSPLTEDKYRKASEDLDNFFKRYGSSVPAPNFAMPVTVPVTNQNALPFSNPGGSLVTPSLVTSSLTDPRLLSPQQPALQRNTVSPALPQRPASAGAMLGGELGNTNGACPSPVGNGYVSARASPNLLPVSNGNSLGKAIPAKSPPPPPQHSNPLATNIRKPDLRVITSQGGKGLMQHLQNAQRLMVSQATHSLTTPVVSVATPSLLTQGLPFSAMPTAYNTDYQLSSAELSSLPAFSSPTSLSLGSLSAWQPQPQHLQQPQQIPVSLSNLIQGSHLPHAATTASISAATLTVNTSPSISIKSEPVSPSRERNSGTPLSSSSFPHQARHEPSGRSPVDSLSSNASSYEGPSEREDPSRADFGSSLGLLRPSAEGDGENPSIKRMRLDAWAT
ncbi:myocyte-specific enhancer factor 2D isoform X7 [Ahaetulla prasina]|uniref:myocyte-specific enhancer factor 2D isoform X7 n=1 Tax=Ahaetulla prasina TaxID=499056 RepID=UPI0026470C10|nr:myocyte-specific enhancer factor 2D isoform X7 [Ahaetulla prasina]